jgi:hypothetical protein
MTDTSDEKFMQVVPPLSFAEADGQFAAWLAIRGLSRPELEDDDIRVDTVRTLAGSSKRRYLVKRSLVE